MPPSYSKFQISNFKFLSLFTLLFSLFFAGCDAGGASRDFNELIPRMMAPVNRYSSPTEAAANLFNVTSPDERRDAVAYLAEKSYGHEAPYMKAYKILTTDPHAMVRAQAMRALGTSHQHDAVPYLVDGAGTAKTGLADADPEVRRDAAQGLAETYNDTAIPALAEHVMKDTDDQVRIACARALKNARNPTAWRALIAALEDRNAAVVYWSLKSLEATTGQHMGYDPKAWLTWYQEKYGAAAATTQSAK